MPSTITQPTKEQVRAYMLAREAARHPPPPPEEIRRQLGWRLAPDSGDPQLLRFYLIPTTCGQLAARIAVDWMYSTVPVLRK
jgi:hypothetical protein